MNVLRSKICIMPVGRVTCSSALFTLLSLYFWLNKEAFLSNVQRNSSCLLVCCFGDAGQFVEVDFSTVSSFDTRRAVRHLGMHGKRYFGTRITRYPNSVATFTLIRLTTSGDISLNPGPDCTASCNGCKKPAWKFPCAVCEKPVRSNQKGILCDGCGKWFHIKCIDMDLVTYVALSNSQDQWFCGGNNCGLPFEFSILKLFL